MDKQKNPYTEDNTVLTFNIRRMFGNNITLLQVLPAFVPMQYNTALGFLPGGVGVLALVTADKRPAMIFACIMGTIGFLRLLQYIFTLNFCIDQLFMKHYITVKTSHPGRIAPNTALCFILSGFAMLITGEIIRLRHRPLIVGLLSSIVISPGIVSFSGE